MKLYDAGVIILLVVISACVVGGIVSSLWMGNDNPIEEVAEEIIKKESGVDVDLTPGSPESSSMVNPLFPQKSKRVPSYV